METYPLILGGVKKHTGEIVNVRFPYTGEIYAKVCQASENDLKEAVAAAVRGFEKPADFLLANGRESFAVSLMRSIRDQTSWSR